MEQRLYVLDTNPVLEQLVLPLNMAERKEMEEDIKNGSVKYVRTWGNVILVDYEYYHYYHRQNIPFCLKPVPLETEMEAVAWVCQNQILRKLLTEEMRKYLIGKRSTAEKFIAVHRFRKLNSQPNQQSYSSLKIANHHISPRYIRERIGSEYDIGGATVRKYESYALSLDTIRELSPIFVKEHLEGKLRMSIESVEKLALLPAETIYKECEKWLSKPVDVKIGRKKRTIFENIQKNRTKILQVASIKNMPEYDPDAEIISLVLTISSWRSSINRVKNVVDADKASREARLRLIEALMLLQSTADKLIDVVKEG